ncbi:MAG TPA: PA2169 family four-helix-bundle protein [Puia sp.]|jgi:uncharacterized protein (TIGR02284 family)|nr:PA2169 family four-helix-bundle protein [Puia sp.]
MGTLQHIQHQISAVNDLIRINNDRVTGYQKAHNDVTEPELKALFEKYRAQSERFAAELREQIHQLGGEPAVGTTLSGKFYRTWLDIKSKVTGKDELSVLAACEYGENVAEKAYRDALDDKELIWQDKLIVALLNRHLKGLIAAHERITEIGQPKNKV